MLPSLLFTSNNFLTNYTNGLGYFLAKSFLIFLGIPINAFIVLENSSFNKKIIISISLFFLISVIKLISINNLEGIAYYIGFEIIYFSFLIFSIIILTYINDIKIYKFLTVIIPPLIIFLFIYIYTPKKLIIEGSTITFKDKTEISYYENNKVKYGILKRDLNIILKKNNVTFSNNTPLEFYDTGEIKSGYLKSNTEFNCKENIILLSKFKFKNKLILPKPSWQTKFYKNGNVKDGYLANDPIIMLGENKLLSNKGSYMKFHQNGQIKSFYLKSNSEFNQKSETYYMAATSNASYEPIFNQNGNLISFKSFKEQPIKIFGNTIYLDSSERIELYNDGSLKHGILSTYAEINGLKINAGEFIYLYKNDEELMLHVINNSGIIDSDIIYLVGDEVLIIPKGSKILEDYYSLFMKITPAKNIFFGDKTILKKNEPFFIHELQH